MAREDFSPHSIAQPPEKPIEPRTTTRRQLGNIFAEYCSTSTIHGVSYIGAQQRSKCERFWWIVMLGLSLYGCAKLIEKIYHKWDSGPVILSFDRKPTPVWQMPFPAVTICPEVKFRPECLNFTSTYKKMFLNESAGPLEEEETQKMLSVLQICDRMYSYEPFKTALRKYSFNQDVVHYLKQISPGAKRKLFFECRISLYPCVDLFKETITDEGICYTFNLIPENEMFRKKNLHDNYDYLESPYPSSNWTPDDGFRPEAELRTYPSRIFGSGFESGMYLQLMIPDSYEESHCREAQGFKMLLHSPAEYPVISKKFIRLTFNHEVTMALKPEIMITAAALRNYRPDVRQCFFGHERTLQFFAIYNQANCELECLTNYTLKLCGCVRFSMPRGHRTRLCESFELGCAITAENDIQILIAKGGIGTKSGTMDHCNCLPACNSIEYNAELTQTKYNFSKSYHLRYDKSNSHDQIARSVRIYALINANFAKLAIYFRQTQYITQKRDELFGWTDFIANCGGVMGLCMGVSLLSLAELFYYCLIRPLILLRYRGNREERNVVSVQPVYSLFKVERRA
ncbi:pickpocket protein 28-like [Toxorhynchites rutilus septentrionalis]|uniref:pickpocket protein 28-like n=1 Tax=Toxorhynchites rutilus septentrionalis TaxID=329112 RepID=UPI002478BC28|nr:pickpocket protein 28-like [Toxorhynchites rutilus septentrionalis]